MTTEQKARAYDEALEKAKKKYNSKYHPSKGPSGVYLNNADLEEIFPELKESEDERIRKSLLAYIKGESKRLDTLKWIAWLEKQKYDRMKPIYDVKESFESALEKAWNDYHNGYENVDKLEDDYVECAHAKGFREGYLFGIEQQKESIEKEYVFRPLAGTDITTAANQAVRRANEGDSLVLAFNGAYIPVRKGCNTSKIVDIYDAFIKKQSEASKAIETVEKIDKYINEHLANAHDMKDSNPDKKYYQGWDDALGKMAGMLQDVYSEEKKKDNKFAPRVLPCSAAWFEDGEEKQKEQEEHQVYKTKNGETITYSETDGYKVCDEKQKESDGIWTEEDDAKVKAMCKEGDLKPSEIAWLKELKNRIVQKEQKPVPDWMPKFLDELRKNSYLDWDEHREMEGKVLAIIRWIAPNYFDAEQKAKAYDESIGRAKEMIKAMTNIGGVAKVDDIQYLFPELKEKESEYERTRKEIVEYFKHYSGGDNVSIKFPKWIEWLENHNPSFKQISDGIIWDSGLRTGIELGKKQKEQKSLNISAASEWLRKHVCIYMNSEYNEFHKCVEYDGSIDKERLVNDFEEAMQKEQKQSINIDQLKSLMLQYLQEAANEKDDSAIEADTDKWARKILLGYDFEQNPVEGEWPYIDTADTLEGEILNIWQKLAGSSNSLTATKDGFREIILHFKNYIKEEQKPAEVDEYKIIKKHITEDSLSSEVNKRLTECGWYVTDEKPEEWSEKDRDSLNDAICATDLLGNDESYNKSHPILAKAFKAAKDWLKSLPGRFNLQPQPKQEQKEPLDKGEISDGYHTFNELYYYRLLYNAAFFNLLPKEWVHKSKRHHDGEECFGGGWFIVMANLPTGQISNHYEIKDWDLFHIPEKETADEWDGHTPQEAAERLHKFLLEKPDLMQAEYLPKRKINDIMSKLTNLSYSNLIPINSEEYKKIDEITSDVFDLLDYPIVKKENLKEDRWHKVKESLPDSTREVICKDAIGNFFIGRYYKGSDSWEVSMYDDVDKSNEDNPPVIMWCDIPSEMQNEQKPETKLTGWVARDSEYNPYSGLGLILFNEKPRKYYDCWRGAIASQLPWESFPDLKWEDEPMKVEVTIRKK